MTISQVYTTDHRVSFIKYSQPADCAARSELGFRSLHSIRIFVRFDIRISNSIRIECNTNWFNPFTADHVTALHFAILV